MARCESSEVKILKYIYISYTHNEGNVFFVAEVKPQSSFNSAYVIMEDLHYSKRNYSCALESSHLSLQIPSSNQDLQNRFQVLFLQFTSYLVTVCVDMDLSVCPGVSPFGCSQCGCPLWGTLRAYRRPRHRLTGTSQTLCGQ